MPGKTRLNHAKVDIGITQDNLSHVLVTVLTLHALRRNLFVCNQSGKIPGAGIAIWLAKLGGVGAMQVDFVLRARCVSQSYRVAVNNSHNGAGKIRQRRECNAEYKQHRQDTFV